MRAVPRAAYEPAGDPPDEDPRKLFLPLSNDQLGRTTPKLYIYVGMYFFFHSKDHLPIHLHVTYQGCEMKATLLFGTDGELLEVQLARMGKASPPSPLAKADDLIQQKPSTLQKSGPHASSVADRSSRRPEPN